MTQPKLKIEGLDALSPGGALAIIMRGKYFPRASRAVQMGVGAIRGEVLRVANQRMKKPGGSWARGVIPVMHSPFTGEVISTSPHHKIVEEGHRVIDQRRMLFTSPKVRISKVKQTRAGKVTGGHRYMFIPFRHSAEELKEAGIYDYMKEMDYSQVTDVYREPSQQEGVGTMVARFAYQWRGRMKGAEPRYEGMVRMGRPGHTQYMTFRAISENPKSKAKWMIPARPGYHIFRDVGRNVGAIMVAGKPMNQFIRDEAAKDVRDAINIARNEERRRD